MVSRVGRENDHQGRLLPIQPVHKAHVSYLGPTYVINKDSALGLFMNNSNDHYLKSFASQLVNFQKLHVFPNFHQSDETEIEIEVQMRYFCHISAEQMKTVARGTQNGSSSCFWSETIAEIGGRRGWWQS